MLPTAVIAITFWNITMSLFSLVLIFTHATIAC
jgi:hypothetical protein